MKVFNPLYITSVVIILLVPMAAVSEPRDSYGSPSKVDHDPVENHQGPIRTMEIPLQFEYPRLEAGNYGIDVVMNGETTDTRPGGLRVPVRIINERFPLGATSFSVDLSSLDVESVWGPIDIGRNPSPTPTNGIEFLDGEPEMFDPPGDHIEWDVGTGIDPSDDRRYAFFTAFIYPVVPIDDALEFVKSCVIRISYHLPYEVLSPAPVEGETYDMLVLCPGEFSDEMAEYSFYRNITGTSNRVVTLKEIESGSIWDVRGRDIQERIKKFIYNATIHWGIDYLMLVGDSDKFPVRHIMVMDGSDDSGSSYTDGRFVPTDLYYSDVFQGGGTGFSPWNDVSGESDLLWGEFDGGNNDLSELRPDLYVGRIPASDLSELEVMLGKIRSYETTARGSLWFDNVTLCGTDTFSGGTPEGEYTSDLIQSNFFGSKNVTKHYQTKGTLSGIANTVNRGCGFLEMSDHGQYTSWAGAYTSYQAYNQANGNKLPVMVMDACLTHGFDNENSSLPSSRDPVYDQYYYAPGPSQSSRECIGEQSHRAPNGGAIVSFGCTRIGWGAHGTSYPSTLSGFMNYRIHKAYSDGLSRPGKMLAKAEMDYINTISVSRASHFKTVTEYVLLGDPALNIGGITGSMVEINPEVDNLTVKPGEVVYVNYTIENIGLLGVPFKVNATHVGGGEINLTVNRTDYWLDPSENASGRFHLTMPEDALAGHVIEVSIEATSDFFGSPRRSTVEIIADRIWDVNATIHPDPIVADLGSSCTGNVKVDNLGNGPERMVIEHGALPNGWDITLGTFSVEISPYDFQRLHFRINISEYAIAGSYQIPITGRSAITPAEFISEIHIVVDKYHSIELEIGNSTLESIPENRGVFIVQIHNSGNSPVEPWFEWEMETGDLFHVQCSGYETTMAPYSSDHFEVGVTPLNGTPVGTYSMDLSAGDVSAEDHLQLYVSVLPVHSYVAVCREDNLTMDDSGELIFDLEIENIGNIMDKFIVRDLSEDKENFTIRSPQISTPVYPGTNETIQLSVSNEDPAPHGIYRFPLEVISKGGAGSQILVITVRIEKRYEFETDPELESPSVEPGELVQLRIGIENGGNCRDSYYYSVSVPPGWEVFKGEDEISCAPFSSAVKEVDIIPFQGSLAGEHGIHVLVRSNGSNKTKEMDLVVWVKRRYNTTVEIVEGNEIKMGPGDVRNISIRMINGGNTPESIEIHASCWNPRWIVNRDLNLDLEAGEERLVVITLQVPENVEPSIFNITLRIKPERSDEWECEIPVTLRTEVSDLKQRIPFISIALVVTIAAIIIGMAIYAIVSYNRKHGGVSIDDAGLEWEEEDEW